MTIPQVDNDPSSHLGATRLAEAFRVFNRASEELAGAYASLQGQVAQLTAELAAANGELRRQYQEKAALTERLALLLDALPAGVVVLERSGMVAQCNPAAAVILGVPPIARSWEEIARQCLRATGTPDEWLIGEGAEEKRVALTVTDLDSAGGRIVLLHDITVAHRLKAQAERNERLAAMGEMAAALAHQLRTPLAAALLYAANLEQAALPDEARVRCAGKAVARLKELERRIRDTLLFARGDTLGREPVETASLVAEVSAVIEPLARRCGARFAVADASGGATLVVERKAIVGALINLLENALEAVESGGRVEFELCRTDGALAFHVRDNGRGIDPAIQGRLFEPFFTTRGEGTGLGLAIARGVARAHGGNIELQSTPGTGAEFILTLPLRAAADAGVPQHLTEHMATA